MSNYRPKPADGTRNPRLPHGEVILLLLLAAALIALLYYWAIPSFATWVAQYVPVSWEENLGEGVLAEIAPPPERCGDKAALGALHKLVERLVQSVPENPYKFNVHILQSEEVNAFALPGGSIVFLQGLLQKARTPGEVAGVMAHELQHVLRRHSTRMIVQSITMRLLVSQLLGMVLGDSGLADIGYAAASVLGESAYSRHHEEEADLYGAKMLVAAGLSPAGMAQFFELLQKLEGGASVPAFLSTHPRTEERMRKLRAYAREHPSDESPILPPADWHVLKGACAKD